MVLEDGRAAVRRHPAGRVWVIAKDRLSRLLAPIAALICDAAHLAARVLSIRRRRKVEVKGRVAPGEKDVGLLSHSELRAGPRSNGEDARVGRWLGSDGRRADRNKLPELEADQRAEARLGLNQRSLILVLVLVRVLVWLEIVCVYLVLQLVAQLRGDGDHAQLADERGGSFALCSSA
eukprot:scaffold80602_cov59-Phaeocystis_antarctica.AAC.3